MKTFNLFFFLNIVCYIVMLMSLCHWNFVLPPHLLFSTFEVSILALFARLIIFRHGINRYKHFAIQRTALKWAVDILQRYVFRGKKLNHATTILDVCPFIQKGFLENYGQGSYRLWNSGKTMEFWKGNSIYGKTMEFEQNGRTYGKAMEFSFWWGKKCVLS